jgi:hypothetical protein
LRTPSEGCPFDGWLAGSAAPLPGMIKTRGEISDRAGAFLDDQIARTPLVACAVTP